MSAKTLIISVVVLTALLGTFIFTLEQPDYANLRLQEEEHEHKNLHLKNKTVDHVHICDHDNFMKDKKIITFEREESPIEATLDHEIALRKQHKTGNWKQIRILADYSNMQTTPKIAAFIKNKLMVSTLGFVQQAYSVYPKTSISELLGQTKCYEYAIPATHQAQGVTNADLVLYVGILNAQGQNWLARAGPCILDKQTGRGVVGIVQFNSFYLSTLNLDDPKDTSWYGWVQTTIHEVTHVLGFSQNMFQYYVNSATNQQIGASKVSTTSQNRQWVTLPGVVQYAQTYFNCPQAWGAPLEDQGGAATAGSHWERTTFGNEAMTGSSIAGSVFSAFTFQLMQGTGWYLPNYDFAQPYVWGKNEGCGIASGQCPTNTVEFCGTQTEDLCSIDLMETATCSAGDSLTSNCPYWTGYSNMDCRQHSDNVDSIASNTGGYVGPGGRCWVTTIPTVIGYTDVFTACYNSKCINGGTQIQVTVGITPYTCTSDGQVFIQYYFKVLNVKFQHKSATITCPSISRFCVFENSCPGDCQGRGTCKGTVCQCWAGFAGADCSTQQ